MLSRPSDVLDIGGSFHSRHAQPRTVPPYRLTALSPYRRIAVPPYRLDFPHAPPAPDLSPRCRPLSRHATAAPHLRAALPAHAGRLPRGGSPFRDYPDRRDQ